MKYICKLCNKDFKQKSNYNVHINRKRPCINIITGNDSLEINDIPILTETIPILTETIPILTQINDKIICEYCNKQFTQKSALSRHINNRCKQNKLIIENKKLKENNIKLKNENKNLKEENDILKNQIVVSKKKTTIQKSNK